VTITGPMLFPGWANENPILKPHVIFPCAWVHFSSSSFRGGN
jgi:hypothetical protein